MKLLHPFMPFLTEELWSHERRKGPKDALIIAPWPKSGCGDASSASKCNAFDLVTAVRNTQRREPTRRKPSNYR